MGRSYRAVRVGGAPFMQFLRITSTYLRLVSYTSFIISDRMLKMVFSLVFRSYPTGSFDPHNFGEGIKYREQNPNITHILIHNIPPSSWDKTI